MKRIRLFQISKGLMVLFTASDVMVVYAHIYAGSPGLWM